MTRTFSFLGWICLAFLFIQTIQAIHLPNNNARHHNLGHFHKLAGSILKEEQLNGDDSNFRLSASVGNDKYRNIEELNEFAEQPKLLERGLNIREISSNPMLALQKKGIHNHKKGFLPVFLAMRQDDDEEGEDDEIVDDDEEIADDDTELEENGDETAEDEGDMEIEGEPAEEVAENGDTAEVTETESTETTEEVPLSEDAAGEAVIGAEDVSVSEPENAEPLAETETTTTTTTTETTETTVAPAETQSSDLGNRIDDMSTSLHSSVDKMKDELTRTGTQIQQNLETDVQSTMGDLTNNVQVTLGDITDLIKSEGKETRQQIAHNTYQLQQQIEGVSQKTDQNSGETINLEIMLLNDDLEEKKEELKQLDVEIAKLQANLPSEGINTCSLYTDCATCAADASCGWCTTEKKCVRGDNMGPLFETCNFYNYQECGGDACSRYRDCYSCILDPFCGWCNNENANNGGSCLEQPENYNGCPGGNNWYHSQGARNQCALPQSTTLIESESETTTASVLSQQESTQSVNTAEGKERQQQEELLELMTQREGLSAEITNIEGQIEELQVRQQELLGTVATSTSTTTVTETTTEAVESAPVEAGPQDELTIISEQNAQGEETTTVIDEETGAPIYEETVSPGPGPVRGEEEFPPEDEISEEVEAEGEGEEEPESESEPSGEEEPAEEEPSGEETPAEEPAEETAEETEAEEPTEEPAEEPEDEDLDEDLDEEPEEPEEEPEDDYDDEDLEE